MQHMEIWLVILFLSGKKIHAKQLFVLTGFMKLGPGVTIKPGNEQCRVVNSLKHGGLR